MTFEPLNTLDLNQSLNAADICTSIPSPVSSKTSTVEVFQSLAPPTLAQHRWIFCTKDATVSDHQDIIGCVSVETLRNTAQYPLSELSLHALIECTPVAIDASTPVQTIQKQLQTHSVCLVYRDNERRINGLLGFIDSVTLSALHTRHKLSPEAQAKIRSDDWIQKVERVATETGVHVYLIGGWVRDFLLGVPSKDLDFAVDGDPTELVSNLVEQYGGVLHRFSGFRGVHWIVSDSLTLDFTGCRCETYTDLGALPVVHSTHIEGDLQRRDFNINAMAIALNGPQFGLLLDPFSGLQSLNTKQISTLHGLSFLQDPTRIFRASRYCARFSYKLSPETRRQLTHAIQQIEPRTMLTVQRIGIEIGKIFLESHPNRAWSRLQHWNLWSNWLPAWQTVQLHTRSQLPIKVTRESWVECWWMQLALALSETERQQWQSVIGTRAQGLKLWNSIPNDISTMHHNLSAIDVDHSGFEVQIGCVLRKSSLLHWLLLEHLHPDLLPLLQWWIDTGQHRRRQTTGQGLLALKLPRGPLFGTLLEVAQHTAWQGGDVHAERAAIQEYLRTHPIPKSTPKSQNTTPDSTP